MPDKPTGRGKAAPPINEVQRLEDELAKLRVTASALPAADRLGFQARLNAAEAALRAAREKADGLNRSKENK